MGNKISARKEEKSIVQTSQKQYNTNGGGDSIKHIKVVKQTEVVDDKSMKTIYREETEEWQESHGKNGANRTSHKKALRISFNRKDMSTPLAQTVESVSKF